MRLIDADAMIDRLKEWDTKDKTDKMLYNFTLNRINEQPTIQPVRHGHWIKPSRHGFWRYVESAYRECDQCHTPVYLARNMRYCPLCGSQNYDDEEWLNILISKPYLKCEEDGEQNECLHDISKNC